MGFRLAKRLIPLQIPYHVVRAQSLQIQPSTVSIVFVGLAVGIFFGRISGLSPTIGGLSCLGALFVFVVAAAEGGPA